jgi:hypothetical protein
MQGRLITHQRTVLSVFLLITLVALWLNDGAVSLVAASLLVTARPGASLLASSSSVQDRGRRLGRRTEAMRGGGGERGREPLSSLSLQRAAVLAAASGAWAGWENSFSAMTARPKPLDESYVSPDLVEWGQVPMGWEVLSCEGAKNSDYTCLERQLARILPEAGCAADNVAISAATHAIDMANEVVCRVRAFPLAGGAAAHVVDSGKWPSGETTAEIMAKVPFIECRTFFYGTDDATGAWPGAQALITPRVLYGDEGGDTEKRVPPSRRRVLVDLKFDPKFATVASSTVVVTASRRLDSSKTGDGSRGGGSSEGAAKAAKEGGLCEEETDGAAIMEGVIEAINDMPAQRRRGSSRLGLEARTVDRAIGGKNWAEEKGRDWGFKGREGGEQDFGLGEAGAGTVTALSSGVTVLRLAGGIEITFGPTGPFVDFTTATKQQQQQQQEEGDEEDPEASSCSAARDPLSFSFLTVALRDADGHARVAVRREFTKTGLLVHAAAAEEGRGAP